MRHLLRKPELIKCIVTPSVVTKEFIKQHFLLLSDGSGWFADIFGYPGNTECVVKYWCLMVVVVSSAAKIKHMQFQ